MKIKTTLLLVFLVGSLFISQTAAAPGDSVAEAVTASLGDNFGSISTESGYFYFNFTAISGQGYTFSLVGPTGTDFDFDLLDSNGFYLDGSYNTNYPETLQVVGISGLITIAVYGYSGIGSFTLTITETEVMESFTYSDLLTPGFTATWGTDTYTSNSTAFVDIGFPWSNGSTTQLSVSGSQLTYTRDQINDGAFNQTFLFSIDGDSQAFAYLAIIFVVPVSVVTNEGNTYGMDYFLQNGALFWDLSSVFYDYGDEFYAEYDLGDEYLGLTYDKATGVLTSFWYQTYNEGDWFEADLNLETPLQPFVESAQFSSELSVGDIFTWNVEMSGNFGDGTDGPDFENGSIIQLEILVDAPQFNNINDDTGPDLSTAFRLTYDGVVPAFAEEDITAFVIPLMLTLSDGSSRDAAWFIEELGVFSDSDSPVTVTSTGGVYRLESSGGEVTVIAEWDTATGILISLDMSSLVPGYEFSMVITMGDGDPGDGNPDSSEESSLGLDLEGLPISPYVFIFTLLAIPILRRKIINQ